MWDCTNLHFRLPSISSTMVVHRYTCRMPSNLLTVISAQCLRLQRKFQHMPRSLQTILPGQSLLTSLASLSQSRQEMSRGFAFMKPRSLQTIPPGQGHLASLASPSQSRQEMSQGFAFLEVTWPLQWLRPLRICNIQFIAIPNEVSTYINLTILCLSFNLPFRIKRLVSTAQYCRLSWIRPVRPLAIEDRCQLCGLVGYSIVYESIWTHGYFRWYMIFYIYFKFMFAWFDRIWFCLSLTMMYLCDCTKHCKHLKEVSKLTYQRHAQFRELDFTNTYNGRPPLRPACDPSSNGTAGLDLGHDGTMAEPHEVCLSYSTSCRLAHLHVILKIGRASCRERVSPRV